MGGTGQVCHMGGTGVTGVSHGSMSHGSMSHGRHRAGVRAVWLPFCTCPRVYPLHEALSQARHAKRLEESSRLQV